MKTGIPKRSYAGTDLAVVVPTKDRPVQLGRLFESLAAQSTRVGAIVVVDHGGAAESVVERYKDILPVICIQCPVPGQLIQRRIGVEAIGPEFRLIGFVDDDMVFEADAMERMIEFWNAAPANTAGVGFNIVNCPPFRFSPVLKVFFRSSRRPGLVLKSGHNVDIQNIAEDAPTEWLGGGYTVWSAQVLHRFPQDELHTRWAIGEDLRFSYPIGKRLPLFVCSRARVRHEHVNGARQGAKLHYFRGWKSVVSVCYFVQLHAEDFSTAACLWMLAAKCSARILLACLRLDYESLVRGVGETVGLFRASLALIRGNDMRPMLEDRA
jgi:glycosyltransferase involved in cell wall biosynthesis